MLRIAKTILYLLCAAAVMPAATLTRAPKMRGVEEIQNHIEALEALKDRGFSSTLHLKVVVPLLRDPNIRDQYLIMISQPFNKIEIKWVVRLINRQLALLSIELERALGIAA
jgi:hypothetical protein